MPAANELNAIKRVLEVGQKVDDLDQSFLWVVISRDVHCTGIPLNPVLVLSLVEFSLHFDGVKCDHELIGVFLKGVGKPLAIGMIDEAGLVDQSSCSLHLPAGKFAQDCM